MARGAMKCAWTKCGRRFRAKRDAQVYCSERCRNAAAQARLRERTKAALAEVTKIKVDELGLPVETEVEG